MTEPRISRHPFGMVFGLGRNTVAATEKELRVFAEKLLKATQPRPVLALPADYRLPERPESRSGDISGALADSPAGSSGRG